MKKLLDLVKKAVKAGKVAINPKKVGKKFQKFMAFYIFLQFGPIITEFFTSHQFFTDLPTPDLMNLP